MATNASSSVGSGAAAAASSTAEGSRYWDDVGSEWTVKQPDRLWREYTDRLQIALLDRWLVGSVGDAGDPPPMLLKTDLFDEVAGRGIAGHLIDRGYQTTGVDISPVVVAEAARRNPGLHAYHADVRDLPFADASFDLVFSGSTLDHFATVGDIARAVNELVRVLRPSGKLLLTLDNPANPLVWLRNGPLLNLVRRFGIVPYQVGVTLDPRRLASLVRSCGLEVRQTTAVLHCPRVLAVRRARRLMMRDAAEQERFLESLSHWERLERWPSRFMSGHFIAILADKQEADQRALPPLRGSIRVDDGPVSRWRRGR